MLSGQADEYRAHLNQLVEQRLGKTENPLIPYSIARSAAILQEDNVPWPDVVAWAESAAEKASSGWFLHVAGLAQLRAGNLDQALERLESSVETKWYPALNQVALCLVHHRRGDTQRAREYLEEARAWFETVKSQRPDGYVQTAATDWLEFNLLFVEAESQLAAGGDPPPQP